MQKHIILRISIFRGYVMIFILYIAKMIEILYKFGQKVYKENTYDSEK